jgi:hypothetical protein
LGGANILIKEVPSTIDSIRFSLWDIVGTTSTEVAWVSWSASEVCAYKNTSGEGCQNFGDDGSQLPLYFTDNHLAFTGINSLTPYTLEAGHDYLALVTSTAESGNSTC